MLLRTYRISDKLGLAVLKSLSFTGALLVDGAGILLGTGLGVIGGGVARAAGLFAGLIALLFRLLRAVAAVVVGGVQMLLRLVFSAARRGQPAHATAGANRPARAAQPQDTMARRAVREEMSLDSLIAEDPLRAQNRALSTLVVVVLAALVVAVIWATSRRAPPVTTASVGDPAGLSVLPTGPTLEPTRAEAFVLASPVPTATTLPAILQVRGSLAFVARERGQTDLWAVPVGGTSPVRITNDPKDERDPAWSPNQSRLAFASNKDGNWELYVLDLAAGTEPMRMTFNLTFEAGPTWSPDGAFIAYESYQSENLDVYILSVDGSTPPRQLPSSTPAAEFSPAWSPEGRRIAYTSWQDGNQEIYVFSLDTLQAYNLTNTPDRNEDHAAWSPDGTLIAYSAVDAGIEKVFIKPADQPESPAQAYRRGRMPAWSPDGSGLVFAVDAVEGTQFLVDAYNGEGVATPITAVTLLANDPAWTSAALPITLVNSGGLGLAIAEPLYDERVFAVEGDPPFRLQPINNVPGLQAPYLSDTVNDSFNALRERVSRETGQDFLAELEAALVDINTLRQPGEELRNWLKTGRAFSINRNLIFGGFPVPVEIVREDTDLETYWRVFVRVSEDSQSGQLGEPLRRLPWQFVTTAQGDVQAYDAGGRYQPQMPAGYYIDFTQLAQDYGWRRRAAGADWRANALTRNYWMFYRPDELSWYEAMAEIWPEGQLINFRPTPTPAPLPTSTPFP